MMLQYMSQKGFGIHLLHFGYMLEPYRRNQRCKGSDSVAVASGKSFLFLVIAVELSALAWLRREPALLTKASGPCQGWEY